MDTEKNKKIETLLNTPEASEADEDARLQRVMRRVRANVGQRDSLLFAVVKFWATIAEMVAPLFAQFAERRAKGDPARVSQEKSEEKNPQSPQTPEGK